MTMRISPEVEIAFSLATREAARRRHEYVTVEHLLYALLFDEETAEVVRHAGGDAAALKKKLEQFLDDELETLPDEDATPPDASRSGSSASSARGDARADVRARRS